MEVIETVGKGCSGCLREPACPKAHNTEWRIAVAPLGLKSAQIMAICEYGATSADIGVVLRAPANGQVKLQVVYRGSASQTGVRSSR